MKKTENSIYYNFSDFTINHYIDLIKETKKKYKFSFYHDFDKNEKCVFWRHDIDFSPHRALRLAQIEANQGVKSTFFIHLNSEFYNVLEYSITHIIKQILLLGHEIGVHFDVKYHNVINEVDIEKKLMFEKQLLEQIFNSKIKTFSFHNTNPFTLSCKKESYANLINVYSDFFIKEMEYCSDSNGYWRYKRMMDVIITSDSKHLHLLTHPEWWTEDIMSPWEKVQRCCNGRAINNLNNYENLLVSFNYKNVDW
jgi:hypothetical protein